MRCDMDFYNYKEDDFFFCREVFNRNSILLYLFEIFIYLFSKDIVRIMEF